MRITRLTIKKYGRIDMFDYGLGNNVGLNIKGNLILVDKEANNKKGSKTIEEFLSNKEPYFSGVDSKILDERLKKIKEFQDLNNYKSKEIEKLLSPLLMQIYSDIQAKQKEYIDKALKLLADNGVCKYIKSSVSIIDTTLKVGALVKQEMIPLFENGSVSQIEVNNLLNSDYTYRTLGIPQFPLLVKTRDVNNNVRYYKDPIVIYGEEYFVCNHWFDKNKENLIKWISSHK